MTVGTRGRRGIPGHGGVLEIDGAAYSGSGMIVRQAVAYSALTGTPITMRSVRARRPRPGLRRQHLSAIESVRAMVGGVCEGAAVGSAQFSFHPGAEAPRGAYRFDVGSAGSATALSLALLPVLAAAAGPVQVDLVGGLFQDRAPSVFHLQHALAPLLGRMGYAAVVTMLRPGYVPTGDGLLRLNVPGSVSLAPLDADRPGRPVGIWGIAISSHLRDRDVSHRMASSARSVLDASGFPPTIEERDDTTARQAGAGLALFADLSDGFRLGSDGAGAPGRPAEAIGRDTANRLLADVRSGGALDRYASDQIVVFGALARGRTRVRLAAVTDHVRAAMWLAELFGAATARLDGRLLTIDGGGLIGAVDR